MKENNVKKARMLAISLLEAFVVSYGLLFLWRLGRCMGDADENVTMKDFLLGAAEVSLMKWVLTAVVCMAVVLFLKKFGQKIADLIYRYRYPLALITLIVLVAFEISGSSIACWAGNLFHTETAVERGTLFGMARNVRMDEWASGTPLALSQYADPEGTFSYFSSLVRGGGTDMFVVYGQAVKSVLMIFKPFYLGYLFLSPARGLSFFWCSRQIALLLVSFEFGMLLTKRQRSWALAYSLLLSFAPTVQWWFATNGLVELLVYLQLSVLMLDLYMRTTKYGWRILYAFVITLCAGGYVLAFYPAWQVPLAYVLLVLILWVLMKNAKTFSFQWKQDLLIMVVALVLLGLGMALFLHYSWDTIETTLNTVYPGKRNMSGGMSIFKQFAESFDLVTPLSQSSSGFNSCESSYIYGLAPAGLVLTGIVLFKEKKKDPLLMGLLVVYLWFLLYETVGFPPILAKLSLLGMSMPERVMQVFGLIDLILLFRAKTLMETRISGITAVILSLVLDAFSLFAVSKTYGAELTGNTTAWVVMAAVQFIVLCMFLYHPVKRCPLLASCLIIALCGILVNPVQKGVDVVYDSDLYKAIHTIAVEDPQGKWTCDCLGYPMNDFAIMAGASSIDSLSTYPDLERWSKLDDSRKAKKVYNRYAHINVQLQQEKKTEFILTGSDAFQLDLAVDDMEKMGLNYVISLRDLTMFNQKNVTFTPYSGGDMMLIYKVSYQ